MVEYVELHCHSCYSLLDGTAQPEALIAQASALGMEALALTDHDAVYGSVPFLAAARSAGIRPLLGAELTLEGGAHLTLLVAEERGWANLCTLISTGQANAPKGRAAMPLAVLEQHTAGLIALSGCERGLVAGALRRGDRAGALRGAEWLRDRFGPSRTFVELQHHLLPGDTRRVAELVALAEAVGVPYVATNNVHYPTRADQPLQDLLVAIRQRTTLDAAGALLRPNSEFYLKPHARLAPLFAAFPVALTTTRRIAEQCWSDLRYGLQDLPTVPLPPGQTADTFLARLCSDALPSRYGAAPDAVKQQLAYELRVIREARLSNYFLIVWDIVRFCRAGGIRCQGRGSAANSLVAYLLAISPIDPLAHDLVFERFLSAERPDLPDIDLDIAADRREKVIAYVTRTYGAQHAAMACTFATFRARSAVREVAAALDLPPALLREALRTFDRSIPCAPGGAAPTRDDTLALVAELCRRLDGLPRHLGQHSGGMVITAAPLATRVPTEPAAMAGRMVVQWDKDALEQAGLVKIDLLGLRMLSALDEAVRLVAAHTGERIDLDRLSFDDAAVYAMLAEADTIGVFQVESRAQAQVLPRLRPACFADLLVAISLIRPGPVQGNMVHPYLRRRQGLEPVTYLHPRLRPALEETLGVVLFQEQVLKVARDLAGWTAGQGERLRRALGKADAAALAPLRQQFVAGAAKEGIGAAIAEQVWQQLASFAGYSFPKSHAAAFAVIVYQSAWLKRYHPQTFYAALLNNQPMGFWTPSVLVGDARHHVIAVLSLDIHRSAWRCTLDGSGIRLGLSYIHGLSEAQVAVLLGERDAHPFANLCDLVRRTQLPRALIERIIAAGGCDGWEVPRRMLLWELHTLHEQPGSFDLPIQTTPVALPPLSALEALAMEHGALGLHTGEHVMARYRPWLSEQGVLDSTALGRAADGQWVEVAGVLVVHQSPPTAKGHHFLTAEDEHGLVNIVVRPALAARDLPTIADGGVILVTGVVQRDGAVVNLVATRLAPLFA